MFLKHAQIAPDRVSALLAAAERAVRAIPPAFPLDATVAVNPFLGQSGEDLATAAARLERVAGVRLVRPREELAALVAGGQITEADLTAALAAAMSPLAPADATALKAVLVQPAPAPVALPTVADLATGVTGTDWPAVIAKSFGLWAAGHFDRGQALWAPAQGQPAFAAWREWATHDLTPEIAGLAGFCAHVAAAPDTPERAILRAAERLGIGEAAAETLFHRLLMDLGGWAQHGRWLLWQAEQEGRSDATLAGMLAARLIWEEALMDLAPQVAGDWARTLAAHGEALRPSADQVADAILQEAAERAWQRGLAARLAAAGTAPAVRPALQAAFCIDVRSEVFRRALEAQDGAIATLGFAGFFGLPASYRDFGAVAAEPHLPVLLAPAFDSAPEAAAEAEQAWRISARARRAWGRFRQAAVSSFAFVESAGPLYGAKLVRDALGLAPGADAPAPAPLLPPGMAPEARAAVAAGALKGMGLAAGQARLVLLVGHGATVTNNAHESAYHCGACGGRTGEVSARLLARLLNDPETRAALPGQGITLSEGTHFLAGLHDTTTDAVTLYEDDPAPGHAAEIAAARRWLAAAGAEARAERAVRLPGATPQSVARRAWDWAETRPEWGLAGCAAFIAAPRAVTAGADLGGRVFLHSYDHAADPGDAILELILTAPVVVASWISLSYYGATVAPTVFGSGSKLIHNVVGGFGVVEGNGGRLRAGLPWQAVHDGERPVHEALRLSVLIEAPTPAIAGVLARHDGVRALFDNGWLHLFALEGGRVAARYRPGLAWEPVA